ncbi:MAG: lamin tail domain-containing protein [Planctomycetes bacterium]|nr:lamin tail domain-containing protein [Planctomycetota bacterium]
MHDRLRISFPLVAALLACAIPPLTAQSGPRVVINEFSYDDDGIIDDLEFVEICNAGSASLDLAGYRIDNVAATGVLRSETIRAPATVPPGGFFVLGDAGVPNVTQVFTTAGDELGQFTHHALELIDPQGRVVDRVDYETSGSTWRPARMEGRGLAGRFKLEVGSFATAQRYRDGADSDVNGADFRFATWTPGTTNTIAAPAFLIEDFEGLPIGAAVPGFAQSFHPLLACDANVVTPGVNPASIQRGPMNPNGGNCGILWDPSPGGGNAVTLRADAAVAYALEVNVYFETAPLSGTELESWSIGVQGTTDPFGHHVRLQPTVPTAFKSGDTGVAWVYQRDALGGRLWLVDFGEGGLPFRVLAGPLTPTSGWHRLALRTAEGVVRASFGGTWGVDGGQRFTARVAWRAAGGAYLCYRETIGGNNARWRPLTIDDLRIEATPARITEFGSSTPWSAGTPRLSIDEVPAVGNRWFAIDVAGLDPAGFALGMLGVSRRGRPIPLAPLAPPGTELLVDPVDLRALATSPAGDASILLSIPTDYALVGAVFAAQAFAADPTLPYVLPWAQTQGLEFRLGY